MKKQAIILWLALLPVLFFQGCATISPFDQFAYVQATSVKVEVLELMDKSTESFTTHQAAVEAVNTRLSKIIEYERHRPKNQITVRLWNKMFSTDTLGTINENSMIPSYWAKWKKDGKARQIFVEEAKAQVAEGLDMIAELESKKMKPTDSKVAAFLSNP